MPPGATFLSHILFTFYITILSLKCIHQHFCLACLKRKIRIVEENNRRKKKILFKGLIRKSEKGHGIKIQQNQIV